MQAAIHESLILPGEVALVPVADFPQETLSQLSFEPGDVAITRARSRTPTRIISGDLAGLLQEFSTASTVIEAILLYSVKNGFEPREMLENAYPFLLQMVGEQLLVPANKNGDQKASKYLQRGDLIGGFTIENVLHSLLDTELYQVRDEAGMLYAMKAARENGSELISHVIKHEAEVLHYLEGTAAPRLIHEGVFNGLPFLVMEWCPGVTADEAATELRESRDIDGRAKLARLCIAIVDAYATLHHRQTIHGDVHPRNIIIDADDQVCLVDFGLARVFNEQHELTEPYRGGVSFFCEPEFCAASLAQKNPPRADLKSEQYSLAALIYYLFSGANYLDFSLEEEVLWRQILSDEPLPFAHHGQAPWPEVEVVLHRALSKAPEDRYDSVADFGEALKEAATNHTGESILLAAVIPSDVSSGDYVAGILERLDWDGRLYNEGLPRPPYASIEYGAAGIAYFIYRAACTREDARLLALADLWAAKAERQAVEENAFTDPSIDVTFDVIGRISPFHSRSGLFMLRYLLAQANGDGMAQALALAAFVSEADQECCEIDITLGKSGVMLNCALFYELLPDEERARESGLLELGARIRQELWEKIVGYGAISKTAELTNLGAAHGWAGILYAFLQWSAITGDVLPDGFEERLRQLAGLAQYVGRGMHWPWDLAHQQTAYMPGWCNGSAGYVFLWTVAYRMFGDERYLELAQRAGWNVWEGHGPSVTLCCGLAGRAYALLNLYRQTEDEEWLERARELGRQAAILSERSTAEQFEGFENSLYKGQVGVAALLVDLEDPQFAAMPFFESLKGPDRER